ncbi:ABC transporter [Talaromyces proteolyticus]|uniref:ABC transporter n=1 Tax=Talaromyces proteolyticus TaxID=1131652 RepID=A0AAD4PY18_9EURO|nr:ABC transporter [Talaromyces proteolyticus]KAH8693924.1 ABC transporter [Talaromyces proteolyticus]
MARCTIAVQNEFGPSVDSSCYDGFDFTLLFEEAFFSIAPSVGFLLLLIPRMVYLHIERTKVRAGWLYIIKLFFHAVYSLFQLLLLALWARPQTPRTDLTLAATSLSFVVSVIFAYQSQLEHFRSVRPSKLLSLYFFFSTLFDIVRVRTIWAIDGLHTEATLFIVSMLLKVVLFSFEIYEKRGFIKYQYIDGSPETWAGVFNRSLFWWLNPLLYSGAKKILMMEDLFPVEKAMVPSPEVKHKLAILWDQCENKEKSHSLVIPLMKTFKWELLAGVIPRLSQTGFTMAQPYLIRSAVILFSDDEISNAHSRGVALIAAFAIVYTGIAISTAQAQHKAYRVIALMRGVLITMIYEKATTMPSYKDDGNAAMTVMSTDIERIAAGFRYIHDTWGSLVEMALSLWLLYGQLSTAGIAPIIVSFICTLIALLVAVKAGEKQNLWIEAIQKRVGITAETLGAMKGAKMSGMVERLSAKITALRENEILVSQQFRTLLVVVVTLANFNTLLTPAISFTIYSLVSRNGKIGTLDSERAFTSLTLFNLFSVFVGSLVESFTDTATSLECIDRIREFLAQEPREDLRDPSGGKLYETTDIICADARCISVGWKGGEPSILHDISFCIRRSTVTMVVGPVGCGKSTLMKALLGETPLMTGKLKTYFSCVGYCSQTPWLTNGTVKENILGASDWNLHWYITVVEACGLQKDFEELANGDQTQVGSKGVSLSGGQKQRLTLARAVYSRIDTILLDDVMSGLDPTTEEHIFMKLLGPQGLLRANGVTVIMVTNSMNRLPFADHIIGLSAEGTILTQGSFEHVQKRLGDIETAEPMNIMKPPAIVMKSNLPSAIQHGGPQTTQNLDDRRESDFSTYKYYFSTAPWISWFVFYFFLASYVFFQSFPSVWVTWWAEDNDKMPNLHMEMRIGIYWMLGVLGIIFLVLAAWCLVKVVVQTTMLNVHGSLVKTVFNAPMVFFSLTDAGETVNRFSQDLELIDFELPLALLNMSLAFLLCVAQLIIIAVSAKYIAATIPVCCVAYFFIQKFYIRTSRQLRLMDIEARAPLFSNFMETMSGLATVRAFGWEDKYRSVNHKHLADSQRPFYLLFAVQRWLSLVLDMTVTGFVVMLMGIAVGTMGKMSGSFLGLALVNVASLSSSIKALITDWTVLETSLGAVTRVKNFVQGTKSEHLPDENGLPPPNWPKDGAITFEGVSAAYNDPSELALKKVSFTILSGEKVAVCGRSGSGKSTLVSALFRMIEIHDGIISIDGLDISKMPRQEVRSALVGLPQDPFIVEGSTVRENVDPFNNSPDELIIHTLKKVEIWSIVEEKGGLDVALTADFLSHGQRQLLCMAKAMLRSGNIVIFDEATSSVDTKTELVIQEIIKTHFQNRTIVCVTHRLDSIVDFDRVLVMDNGILVEDDQPRRLLAKPSVFRELYKSCRGWQEYERQEKAELERIENRRQKTVRARERIQKGLSIATSNLPQEETSPEKEQPTTPGETQEESALRSTISEHWSHVNELFRIRSTRERSRSADRESNRHSAYSAVSETFSPLSPGVNERRSIYDPTKLVSATIRRG